MLRLRLSVLLGVLAIVGAATPARAANILLVSDSGADLGIAMALMADGHTVTIRMDEFTGGSNPALLEDLSAYEAVFWSQDGFGSGDSVTDPALFTNLTSYVMDGGRVFVTGYDSIASPGDPMLIAFLGGSGSADVVGPPGPVMMIENSLTVGVVDIRGVTPTGGVGDTDHMTGLMTDTVAVANSASGSGAQWTLRTLGAGEIAYISNGSSSTSWVTTTTGGAGAYNAAIRNFASAADAASSEPGAPEIEFDRVFGADEGDEVVLTVTVSDPEGDAFTYSWDLDDDGTFGENAGMPTYTIPAGTSDGDTSIRVAVEASDGTHTGTRARTIRIRNVAPRITSTPPTQTSVGEMLRYQIETEDPAGALDPMTYSIVRGPMGAAINDAGVFVWTPTDLDVTRPSEPLTIEVAVDDGDGGTASQLWEMTVLENRTPGAPSLIYPANGIVIADPQPRLVAQNATDPDVEDTLTYFFELDDEDTFADPVIARGEMLPQGTGFTAFELSAPLAPGRYHWRAWAFDGAARSDPMTTSFVVVPDPRIDSGAEPPDGGIMLLVPDAGTTTPPTDRGCGCSAPGARSGGAAGLLGLLGLALVLVRRRSRTRRVGERSTGC